MITIYKYQIPVKETVELELPKEARIIRVEDVDGEFFLWAVVETDEYHPKEKRFFELYKTGQEIKSPITELNYLGNCKIFIGQELCLYVFENLKKSVQWNTANYQQL